MARAAPLSHPHRPKSGRPPKKDGGRGARSNASGRYEKLAREPCDDGWDMDDDAPPLKTEVTPETPRKIINYVNSPFVGFDRSINPYRGCEHGCVYCFARPTHAYYGLSAGLDFERNLFAKPNAAALLERELKSKNYAPRHIAIGTNTDPYQPIERQFKIMRGILRVLTRYNHPVSLLTKSANIARDIDLLKPMAEAGIVRAMLSITTLCPKLARAMEPRASSPRKRLDAITRLRDAGVPVGVMTAPMIPGLNDQEMESILEAAKNAGADFAGFTILRLPLELETIFAEWLENAYPNRKKRVINHLREMNGGRIYDVAWSRANKPKSVFAKLLSQRFDAATRRLGLKTDLPHLDGNLFRRPLDDDKQLSLFSESPSG